MWSLDLDASISGVYQTLGGHSSKPSESLGAPATSLGAATTSVGAPATCLGAHRITGEQSGKNNNFFGNADGAPGNNTYYLLFNDC
jgi:hypothetical protein